MKYNKTGYEGNSQEIDIFQVPKIFFEVWCFSPQFFQMKFSE